MNPTFPLLIAITGAVGTGKTRTLTQLANALASEHRVDGFLALAGARGLGPERGADSYQLSLIGGPAMPWAERHIGVPGYQFRPETETALDTWLAQLVNPKVLLLDEFGSLEAAGKGHYRLWPGILAKAPETVIIAVRESQITAIEQRLQHPFDARIDACDPRALESIRRLLDQRTDFERIGWFGAAGGALEIGAGSIVHGANIPLGGLGMVSTQCLLLTQAAEGLKQPGRVAWVAQIAAGMKALSPAGQRIRPMVAISVQGWLYGLSIRVLGWNVLAVIVAGALMGAWAGSQGMLLQWLLVGSDFVRALERILSELGRVLPLPGLTVPMLVAIYLAIHALGVSIAAAIAWRLRRRDPDFARLQRASILAPSFRRRGSPWLHALRDLAKPSFWLPLSIIMLALSMDGRDMEALFWLAFRAFTIAWLLFALVRQLPLDRASDWLRARGLTGPAHAWTRSLEVLGASKRSRMDDR